MKFSFKFLLKTWIFLSAFLPVVALADVCLNPDLGKTPVLAQGRVMPLLTHARLFRSTALNKKQCKNLSDVALYCYLSLGQRSKIESQTMANQAGGGSTSGTGTTGGDCKIEMMAEHKQLRALLGIDSGPDANGHFVSPKVVFAKKFELENDYRRLEAAKELETGYGVGVSNLAHGMSFYEKVVSGNDWMVLKGSEWVPVATIKENPDFESTVMGSTAILPADQARAISYEVIYEKTKIFYSVAFICLLAFLFSLIGLTREAWYRAAVAGAVVVLAVEVVGMILRSLISGRAPVTNMFETVMWTGFGVLALSILMAIKMKEKKILVTGLVFNLIALFMMNFATTMFDGTIRPLVPVLRDNFWLSTHVTTVTLSYACFALAWVMANSVLLAWIFGRRDGAKLKAWNHIIRTAIQIGSVLLAAGVILGGVWADYSWGRFWGWDPKETWSLIALLVYMAILHGKYAGWFKDLMFTMVAAAGFLSVLMAWFGVNYILAVGLHSYGFSSGGATFLFSVFAAQIFVLALAALQYRRVA